MKIACQSCQAKYTIADEKVVGKVVKIRCKKCGATIVVNGQDDGQHGGSANEERTEIRASGADFGTAPAQTEGWTVNVADDDQRTLTTQQVAEEFSRGTINDETYCWRDGMGDWLPLREIEELSAACGLTAAATFAQQPAAVAQPARAAANPASVRPQAAAASGGGLSNLFGSSPPPAVDPQPMSKAGGALAAGGGAVARRAGGRAGGADLFGAAAEAGGENDVMTSAPQSGAASRGGDADSSKMTGQRNENSVLFSLNALTASAPKKSGDNAGAAEGDGSGLIDIRALSSSMGSSGGSGKKTNHADDIMNLGGGGAFSAALAAPVLTAPPLDQAEPGSPTAAASNQKVYMMFGGLAALLVGGMVIMFFALKPPPPTAAATAPEGSGAATAPAVPAGATSAASPGAAPASAPADTAAAVAAADTSPKPAAPSVGVKPRPAGAAPAAATPPAAVAAAEPPPPKPAGGPASLDQLMAQSAGTKAAPVNAAPAGGASAPFDRGAAAASLGSIADSVASCKKPGGPTGEGHVSITFSPGGTVVSAIVDQPPYAGTAVGGCVAGKFRGAHVPPFAGGNMPVGKRFTIN